MADLERAKKALMNAHNAGDVASAKQLANYIKSQESGAGAKQSAQSDGLFSRLDTNWQKRQARIDQAAQLGAQGKLSPATVGAISGASDVGYYFGDVPTEIFKSGINALPQGVKDAASNVGNTIYSGLSAGPIVGPALRGAGNVLSQAGQGYNKFKQNNPELGLLADAAVDVGTGAAWVVPLPKGLGITTSPAKAVLDAPKMAVKTAFPTKFAPDVSSDDIRKIGGDLFKKATAEGGVIAPEIADQYRSKVLSTLNLEGEAKLYASNPVAERLVNNIAEFEGKPLTFETAKAIDESLGDLAYSTMDNFGKIDSTGKKFLDLQHDLRGAMATLPNSGTIGQARKYWSTSLKMQDIQRIIDKAGAKEQPVTSLKNGFASLLNSKKITQYSPKEVAAIERAAKTGIVTDVIKLAGSGLVPIGSGIAGSMGGVAGSAAGFLAGSAVQQGAKAVGISRQMGRANNALQSVVKSAGLPTEKLTLKQIMKLPPEQAQVYLKNMPAKEQKLLMSKIKQP
jgi:hypothetical protein